MYDFGLTKSLKGIIVGAGALTGLNMYQNADIPSLKKESKPEGTAFDSMTTIAFNDAIPFSSTIEQYRLFEKSCVDYIQAMRILEQIVSLIKDANDDPKKEKDFISFIECAKDNRLFPMAISLFFDNTKYWEKQCWFLDTILMSDIDIFVPWYKMSLILASNSNNPMLSFVGKDIFKLYEKRFETVGNQIFN